MAEKKCPACFIFVERGLLSRARIQIEVYEVSDLGDPYKMLHKVRKQLEKLEDSHAHYLKEHGGRIGKDNFDLLEDKLEAVLDEYIRVQMDIDEKCKKAENIESKCGPNCIYLQKKWSWYNIWYTQKGICVSKERAEVLNEKYKEGFEQLADVSAQINVLERKREEHKRLTTRERERYKYLIHLTKTIDNTISADKKELSDLAVNLTLANAFRKIQSESKDSTVKEFYNKIIQEAEAKATKIQKELRSNKITWAIVSIFSMLVLAVLMYVYKDQGMQLIEQFLPRTKDTLSFPALQSKAQELNLYVKELATSHFTNNQEMYNYMYTITTNWFKKAALPLGYFGALTLSALTSKIFDKSKILFRVLKACGTTALTSSFMVSGVSFGLGETAALLGIGYCLFKEMRKEGESKEK